MLVDKQLIEARKALEACDLGFRALEQDRHRVERELSIEREKLSGVRLEEQSLRMRADSHAEAIAGAGFASDAVAAELPPEANITDWEAKSADL